MALDGRDVFRTAQTGTGKTGAFAIPVIEYLLKSPRGSALIMTPTRELATQVDSVLRQMLQGHGAIKTACLIGGEPMPKQLAQLRARPRIIIGTPGRINDHLTRGSVMMHDTGLLVLDETDRMLDMGFGIQIDAILKFMPKTRQTLLFSATLPPEILKISKKYLTDPERVEIGQASQPALNIEHKMERATDAEKYPKLLEELAEREGSVIIFVKTKRGCDKLATKLDRSGHTAEAIHGDLRQSQRDRVIKAFRNQRYRIMVATDVAARGLDIPHIEHVINYDLPQCAEDYIHRIGRTARAGAKGAALCFVSPEDGGKWRAISRLLNPGQKVEGFEDERGGDRRGRGGDRGGFSQNRNRDRKPFGARREGGSFGDRPRQPRQFGARDEGENRGEARQPRAYNENRTEGRSEGRFDKPRQFNRDDNRGGEQRPRRSFNDGDERRAPRGQDSRGERDGNRAERGNASAPAFVERPYRERSVSSNEQGTFRKRSEDRPRREGNSEYAARPPRERREFGASRDENRGNRERTPSANGNVMRHDGPGSNYFRPDSADGNKRGAGKPAGNRPARRDQGEYAGKPRSFDGGKPRSGGSSRFDGSDKKGKFAA